MSRRICVFLTPTGAGVTTEKKVKELEQAVAAEEPITKLELDRSRRKLDFADCEAIEEITLPVVEAVKKVGDREMVVDNMLTSVLVSRSASRCSSGKSSALATPTSVLGINLTNAYTVKPRNREHRIEMKYGSQ